MKSSRLRTVFDVSGIENKISELEEETFKPDFWRDSQRAGNVNKEISDLKEEINFWQNLEKQTRELLELLKVSQDDSDAIEEIGTQCRELQKNFKKEELKIFLSGKYDKGNAILSIYSGAGGIDAQDWANILFRMYQRYAESKGYEVKILHQSFGEGVGPEGHVLKNVTIEVAGLYAYGYLKSENGVHRLVRISPFSAQKLRHTSFALVEVLPDIPEPKLEDIEIKPEDLKVDTFRASGPGGQYVNRRESAVRVHHLPTGLMASCQSERLQGENKTRAMKILVAKLYSLKLKQDKKEISQFRGKISPEWGNQIRSYILHPYKLVRDLRTNIETSDVESVLDGELDEFIEAEIKSNPKH